MELVNHPQAYQSISKSMVHTYGLHDFLCLNDAVCQTSPVIHD